MYTGTTRVRTQKKRHHVLWYVLLYPVRMMLYMLVGDYLAQRVEELKPECHVYGHTHFTQDHSMDGTRYVQWPLGYPREMRRRRDGGKGWKPLMLWDIQDGHSAQRSSYWSDFYRNNERKPHIVTPAPYVATKSPPQKSSMNATASLRATF